MDSYESFASQMCKQIKANSIVTQYEYANAIVNNQVLDVMEQVPRHVFVENQSLEDAYLDSALPISHGQTISQPYIVALMTSLLEPEYGDKMLEVGTGSGYQAAVLSKLVQSVYTLEIIPELYFIAKNRFKKLGLNNIFCKCDSGVNGWPEFAPYDGIIVTAASLEVPTKLIEQLKIGGRLVIPLQEGHREQNLYLLTKTGSDSYNKDFILPVRFVPFQ